MRPPNTEGSDAMSSISKKISTISKSSNRILSILQAADRTENPAVMNLASGQPNMGFQAGVNR
jgi:hypothetical protein